MNRKSICIGLVLMGAMTIAVTDGMGQPGRAEARAGGRPRERVGEERRGSEAGQRGDVDQWLERLQADDPDEYERLVALRETHPVAFRVELRRRVQERRVLQTIQEEFPGFYSYLQGLSLEERDRLGHFLQDMAQNRPGASARPRTRFADLERDLELRRMARAWREAETPEERTEIEAGIRQHVEALFDERTQAQRQEVQQLEQQVNRLQTMLETREARRDQWIDQVMRRVQSMEE